METRNDFMIMRETVNRVVSQYTELRKKIKWKDTGKSATIYRLAKPFQTGYFTIAIAGKMSSGKSTFINSLIGENLLPTGIFQTTSGITWIVSSDRRYMEVTYADGNKKIFTEHLAEELKKLVAIPEEFHSLPINHINILIRGNNDIAAILKKKAGIEEMTDTSSDEKLWKKYIASTPKSKIADKVTIYLPLPAEYKGWRIVDTPGIGAIGGIQDATKKLITSKEGDNNTVDAVILLQNGVEGVEDESANRFAKEVRKSMGNLAKGRLFFVLTHAGDAKFLSNKDGILGRAYSNFGTKLDIPKERVTYVDSLIHHFLVDARKSHRDFSNPRSLLTLLDGWTEEDWNALKAVVSQSYFNLQMSGNEVNNNSLFAELESVSRFKSLRDLLYDFLNKEKQNTFNELLTLINGELENYRMSLRNDIQAVSNGQAAIDRQIKEAEKEGRELNLALNKVQQRVSTEALENAFRFIEPELNQLSKLASIGEIRTQYLQIIQEGLSKQKEFFEALKADFSQYVDQFETTSVTLFKSLDLDDLERKANDKATAEVTDYSRSVRKLVGKGGWSSDDKYETIYPYTKKKTDFEQKRREFAALVITEGRKHISAYKDGMKVKAREFLKIVSQTINEKTCATIERLKQYKKRMTDSDTLLKELRSKLAEVECQLAELKKYED